MDELGPAITTELNATQPPAAAAASALGEEKKQEEFETSVPPVDNSEKNLLLGCHDRVDTVSTVVGGGLLFSSASIGTMSSKRESAAIPYFANLKPRARLTKAMEIMMTTTCSTTPSPLSGWCGSALMCASCRHVRPIQNVPFLDIPVVPTAVSHYGSHPAISPGARKPPLAPRAGARPDRLRRG